MQIAPTQFRAAPLPFRRGRLSEGLSAEAAELSARRGNNQRRENGQFGRLRVGAKQKVALRERAIRATDCVRQLSNCTHSLQCCAGASLQDCTSAQRLGLARAAQSSASECAACAQHTVSGSFCSPLSLPLCSHFARILRPSSARQSGEKNKLTKD